MPSPRRLFRFSQAIHRRQTDLIVALDRVHDRHNISAIMRTADAVGIPKVIWSPDVVEKTDPNPEVAQGAERWVELQTIKHLLPTISRLRGKGFRVASTHLGAQAVDFRDVDWTQPWVLVMGNERRGVSDEILAVSDTNIFLPMMGLIQSLNVSVATAVVLYEIQRQRQIAGLYQRTLPRPALRKFFQSWSLAEDGFTLKDVGTPPEAGTECPPETHVDGRTSFADKLRNRRRRKDSTQAPKP